MSVDLAIKVRIDTSNHALPNPRSQQSAVAIACNTAYDVDDKVVKPVMLSVMWSLSLSVVNGTPARLSPSLLSLH